MSGPLLEIRCLVAVVHAAWVAAMIFRGIDLDKLREEDAQYRGMSDHDVTWILCKNGKVPLEEIPLEVLLSEVQQRFWMAGLRLKGGWE